MTKSVKRKLQRTMAQKLAQVIIKELRVKPGEERKMPTIEQLYLLIGAKDGMIYDLQLNLQGIVADRDALKAELEGLKQIPSFVEKAYQTDPVAADAEVERIKSIQNAGRPVDVVMTSEDNAFKGTFKP